MRKLLIILSFISGLACVKGGEEKLFDAEMGPFFDSFGLTLKDGRRTEAAGPLFFSEETEDLREWGLPPVYSFTERKGADSSSWDFLYPVMTYDRYGAEYRFQFFQLLSFAGGETTEGAIRKRQTLFPIYFRQKSTHPEEDYWALLPIYGHLHNRLMRDEIRFALFPIWGESRKKDVVTENFLYPFFHVRHGDNLKGWQFWPLFGRETKGLTTTTNGFGETTRVGGHHKVFILWPFFHDSKLGLGTEPQRQQLFFPFYSFVRSPLRDSTSYGWPLGYTHTIDREKKFEEKGMPWPFVLFAHGEGKSTWRIWPFYSTAKSDTLESRFVLWPVYKFNAIHSEPLDRQRTRILFFLYSQTREENTAAKTVKVRQDFFPFYTWRKDHDGRERLQILSILEPFLPTSTSIERNWSPLWSIWRQEKNPSTQASSQSLLWNLYRRETRPEHTKVSILGRLFQYQKSPAGVRGRIAFIPWGDWKDEAAPGKN